MSVYVEVYRHYIYKNSIDIFHILRKVLLKLQCFRKNWLTVDGIEYVAEI